MLADPRSDTLATRFAAQWLRLQRRRPHPARTRSSIPYFDRTLGDSLIARRELFFDSIVREDRSVLDLLTADYTFVERAASRRHYGIPNVTGTAFRRVDGARVPARPARPRQHAAAHLGGRSHLAGDARQVGHGSAAGLAAAAAAAERAGARSRPTRTSADEMLHGARAHGGAPREPGVRVVPPRDRSARPGARNFDVTGAWRIKDNGKPVDATERRSTTARQLDGPADLRAALLKPPGRVPRRRSPRT